MTMGVFERSFQISDDMNTVDDVRFLVALRLSRHISFLWVICFLYGFWAEVFGSTPGADEFEAYALQFYFVFAGCDILIEDEVMRTKVMALWRGIMEVHRKTRTGVHSWWTRADLEALRQSQDETVALMKDIQEFLESPVPLSHRNLVSNRNHKTNGNSVGAGWCIEKLGEWRFIPTHLERAGSLSSTSTKVKFSRTPTLEQRKPMQQFPVDARSLMMQGSFPISDAMKSPHLAALQFLVHLWWQALAKRLIGASALADIAPVLIFSRQSKGHSKRSHPCLLRTFRSSPSSVSSQLSSRG
jgi:hypothetical protein